jgi:hypothetical protein
MRLTLLFIFTLLLNVSVFAQANRTESFAADIEAYELRVYPNPTTDSFQVVDNIIVDEIVIYNIIGRKIRTFTHESNKKYSLGDLPDGMYFIGLISETEGVLKTLRISKRVMRP